MRNLIAPAVFAAFIAASPLAFAAQQSTGTIKSIDTTAMTLTLNDGTVYYLPKGFNASSLRAGEKVQISWNMQNGQHDAVTVTAAK